MSGIPASHLNFIHLLLKEVAREATYGRILAIRNICGGEIEQRFAIIERNANALRGLLPHDDDIENGPTVTVTPYVWGHEPEAHGDITAADR